jgi:hypothetical protein
VIPCMVETRGLFLVTYRVSAGLLTEKRGNEYWMSRVHCPTTPMRCSVCCSSSSRDSRLKAESVFGP